MSFKYEPSEEDDKNITEALRSSRSDHPELMSRRIRKAAIDSLEADKKNKIASIFKGNSWFKLFPIAACILLSFYAGRTLQTTPPAINNDRSLVFQGIKANNTNSDSQELSQDGLLKAIAESALAGDIQKAEELIAIYKEKYPMDNQ